MLLGYIFWSADNKVIRDLSYVSWKSHFPGGPGLKNSTHQGQETNSRQKGSRQSKPAPAARPKSSANFFAQFCAKIAPHFLRTISPLPRLLSFLTLLSRRDSFCSYQRVIITTIYLLKIITATHHSNIFTSLKVWGKEKIIQVRFFFEKKIKTK